MKAILRGLALLGAGVGLGVLLSVGQGVFAEKNGGALPHADAPARCGRRTCRFRAWSAVPPVRLPAPSVAAPDLHAVVRPPPAGT